MRGLLGPVGRKDGWQLVEYAGHATPDGLQHLLARSRWTPTVSATTSIHMRQSNSAHQKAC
ncbi:hypothetical protein OG467_07715 [Streptomyces sp. NBC_01361]|nr:hypothetical protein [Streptomyces sp. NBC_01361]